MAKCPACLGAIDLADDALFLTGCPHCHMVLPRGRDQWEKLAKAGEAARLRVALERLARVGGEFSANMAGPHWEELCAALSEAREALGS